MNLIKKFWESRAGVAAIEMALAMPILFALSIGGFEITRYILVQQKVSKTVSAMADLVARSETISYTDINNMMFAVDHLMEPYTFGPDGLVIISSVSNNGTNNIVNWQRFGGGTYSAVSKIGVQTGTATLPAGFTLASGEDTVIAEVYYRYTPLIGPNFVATQVIYKVKYAKGRLGALTSIIPS